MTPRTLRWLLLALVALLAIWALATFRARGDASRQSVPALSAFFEGLDQQTVSAVRLTGPRDTVTLTRQDGGWAVNGFRSDSAAVALLWHAVRQARAGEVVATSPANHGRLGVTADSAWRAEFQQGDSRRTVYVGTAGPRPAVTYLRFPDQDTVYHIAGELHLRVAHPVGDWRDRRILAVDTARTARIQVELGRQRYAIVRDGGWWTLDTGEPADTGVVRTVLAELARLRAVDFLLRRDSIARRPRYGSVTALAATGDTLGRVEFGAGPGDRWARARGDSVLYRLGYYRVERVAPEKRRAITGDSLP